MQYSAKTLTTNYYTTLLMGLTIRHHVRKKKMAARLRKTHQDDVRTKIKVTELINRVQAYALGELQDADVSSNRLNAIKMLLAKALPDLSSVEITGNSDNPLETISRIELIPLRGNNPS
jgi:hypothetical protein